MEEQAAWSPETLSWNEKMKNHHLYDSIMSNLSQQVLRSCLVYLSVVSFLAGVGLLFFESVDSRLQATRRFSVNGVGSMVFDPEYE